MYLRYGFGLGWGIVKWEFRWRDGVFADDWVTVVSLRVGIVKDCSKNKE